jgi:glycosyltransferase involved in cell wall biosynthesis
LSQLELTKQPQRTNPAPELLFTLIIPTFNSSLSICQVLSQLCHGLEQSGCQAEIIVVDGGSCDETVKIVQRIHEAWMRLGFIQHGLHKKDTQRLFTGRIHSLSIVESESKDVYHLCHEGIKYASGSIVCFIPDDALLVIYMRRTFIF